MSDFQVKIQVNPSKKAVFSMYVNLGQHLSLMALFD